MKKGKLIALIVCFALVLTIAVAGYPMLSELIAPRGAAEKLAEVSENATTDFTVADADGNATKLSEFFGKPIVVNFWATWCGPCRSELPAFEKIYQEYGEDVTFLMVDLTDGARETVAGATEFVQNGGYTFPVYFDIGLAAANTYAVYSIPMTLLIGADGTLQNKHLGAMTEAKLTEYVTGLLQTP